MVVMLLKILILISCAKSESESEEAIPILAAATPTATISNSSRIVECGNTKQIFNECFKDLPPHLVEFLQSSKIAINKQEIIAKCKIFNWGMKCFDEYTTRCLTNKYLGIYQNNIEGARRFFIKFCGDTEFQRDYLRHKDCFSHVQDDWVRCTKDFQNILSNELQEENRNVTNKFMEFCCARYAYENCIYNAARYKCYKNSAKFARDTAKMLSDEKHFRNCRQYENALCAGAHPAKWRNTAWLLLGLTIMIVLTFLK